MYVVGLHKILISFVLLFVLGLSIASQAFGENSHTLTCKTDRFESEPLGICNHDSLSTSTQPENQSPKHCHDPCHLGFNHFGHGSALVQNYSFGLLSTDLNVPTRSSADRIVKAPDLDGPRRPPRLS